MKTVKVIKMKIKFLDIEIKKLEDKHNVLDQISMLSGEGSKLREQINRSKGFKEGLEYVLKSHIETIDW